MKTRILLVDDEKAFIKGLSVSLEMEGYEVVACYDGEQAWQVFKQEFFDLVLLDLMLPGLDGLSLCKRIRQKSEVPLIMLTAKGEDIDKILGLELGADDYLTKPFNTRELLARIKAVLRRGKNEYGEKMPNGLLLDEDRRRVQLDGEEIQLTVKEFDLLALMWKNPGRVFTREKLLDLVWGFEFCGDTRTVDVHIRRLREKIERDPAVPRFVKTRWGVGYYFEESDR